MEILKDYIDYVILGSLGLMAFIALYCVIERMLFLKK